MNFIATATIALAIALPAARAEEQQKSEQAAVTFDSVVPARQLINKVILSKDGTDIGNVADIIVDREYGTVAFLTARTRRSIDDIPNVFAIPAQQLSFKAGSNAIRSSVATDDLHPVKDTDLAPTRLTEKKKLLKLYDHYGVKPYWGEESKSDTLNLITVDEMDGRVVRDGSWDIVGRVQEILLAPQKNWQVAYISLSHLDGKSNSDERVAVPMSAFALKALSPTWLLDLPEDTALLQRRFDEDNWPLEIHRGWIEYTHVRYGSSALNGLQQVPDEE